MGYNGKKGFGKPTIIIESGGEIPNPNLLAAGPSKCLSGFSPLFGAAVTYPTDDNYNDLAQHCKVANGDSGSGGTQALLSSHYPGWQVPAGDYCFQSWIKAPLGETFTLATIAGAVTRTGTGEYECYIDTATFSSPDFVYLTTTQTPQQTIKIGGIKLENGLIPTGYVAGVQ